MKVHGFTPMHVKVKKNCSLITNTRYHLNFSITVTTTQTSVVPHFNELDSHFIVLTRDLIYFYTNFKKGFIYLFAPNYAKMRHFDLNPFIFV